MQSLAIVLGRPHQIRLAKVPLVAPEAGDVVVSVSHTGISAGTERLLWQGAMPTFPGMGYPLVPGYETVGRVAASNDPSLSPGDAVFVPGAHCFQSVRSLFGGAASMLVSKADRLVRLDDDDASMTLLALAATAHNAIRAGGPPELIIGHGVLGALVARITVALGNAPPTVHELAAERRESAAYPVLHPQSDDRHDYARIIDASGDENILDLAISRLAKGGLLTLAGFYGARLSFAFPPAFMRGAGIRIAAQWETGDLETVRDLVSAEKLSLDGIITHRFKALDAEAAYLLAFTDPHCRKMVLNWGSAR
ncbi:MAG: chlorophyll synthesis pathway protein BchC [Pseudomonadota bacterium]